MGNREVSGVVITWISRSGPCHSCRRLLDRPGVFSVRSILDSWRNAFAEHDDCFTVQHLSTCRGNFQLLLWVVVVLEEVVFVSAGDVDFYEATHKPISVGSTLTWLTAVQSWGLEEKIQVGCQLKTDQGDGTP